MKPDARDVYHNLARDSSELQANLSYRKPRCIGRTDFLKFLFRDVGMVWSAWNPLLISLDRHHNRQAPPERTI